MKKPHLSIIIPVLNLWKLTCACLESLKEHTRGRFYEVIVVDNGSSDETPVECSRIGEHLFGKMFKYIRVEENINFGPACNLGACNASGSLLFFLNNDTLLTPGWFIPLFEVFKKNPRAMAVSPLCLFPDSGRVQHLGIAFDGGLGVRHPYFLFPGDHPVIRKTRKLQALSAAALMIPAQVFNELQGFFPAFINGFEDIDFCCRIRRCGGELVQENSSIIYHLASQTPGRNKADASNIKLINERCSGCFTPDLHKIAAADGYKCRLTPWQEMIVSLPDTGPLDGLDKLSDRDEILSALNEEPLWESGYDRLAVIQEKHGEPDLAVKTLFCGAALFPTPDRLQRLAGLAERAGEDEICHHVRSKIAGIEANLANPQGMRKRAENVILWAQENSDTLLSAVYGQWLAELQG